MRLASLTPLVATLLHQCSALPVNSDPELFYESRVTYKVIPELKKRASAIQEAIQSDGVLPHFLGRFYPPGELFVEYPYGDGYPVSYGGYISPMYVIEEPSVTYEGFFPYDEHFGKDFYLLAVTDIAPTSQENARAVWINLTVDKKNIKEKTFSNATAPGAPSSSFSWDLDLEDGKALVPYIGPQPAGGTGEHLIVFILFRQSLGRLPYHHLKQRLNWGTNITGHGIEDWAGYYGLQPIGVNYFTSSNEGLF